MKPSVKLQRFARRTQTCKISSARVRRAGNSLISIGE